MSKDRIYYTPEGLQELRKEVEKLKKENLRELSLQLSEAASKGDLKENAEYHAARSALSLLRMKIKKMESDIINARLLDCSKIDTSKASILTKVHVRNMNTNKQQYFWLVSGQDADAKTQKISINSPIGRGLLGKKIGEEVKITIPAGELIFKILKIEK